MSRVGSNFSKGLFVYGAPVLPSAGKDVVTGNVWFVDSGAGNAVDDVLSNGKTKDNPFATIDYAIGQCTANNGDVIYVMPGHQENVSSSGSIVPDVAGISIIGLGSGDDRPELTYIVGTSNSSGFTSSIHVTGAGTKISNIIFDCGTTGDATNPMYGLRLKANDIEISNCTFRTSGSSSIWGRRSGKKGIKWSASSGAGIIFIGSSKGSTLSGFNNIKICFNEFIPGADHAGNSSGTSIGINLGSSRKAGNSSGTDSQNIQIIGNLFNGNFAHSAIFGGSSGTAHKNMVIAHNWIWNEQAKAISTGSSGQHGIDISNAITGMCYKNIILASGSSATAALDPGNMFCADNWTTNKANGKGAAVPTTT